MAASSSPDGVREDDFIIPAVPSNDDFESDPEVCLMLVVGRVEKVAEESGGMPRAFSSIGRRCRRSSSSSSFFSATSSLLPGIIWRLPARSLVLESICSPHECFQETRI